MTAPAPRPLAFAGAVAAGAVLAAVAVLAWSQRDLRSDSAAATARVATLERRVEEDAAEVARLRAEIARRDAAFDGLAAVVESAGRGLEASREEGALGRDALEDRLEVVEQTLATVATAVEELRRRTVEPPVEEAALTPAEERACLDRLVDPNPGIRLSALVLLRRGGGEAARTAVVRGLVDPEGVVRREAARLAVALDVREALPGLVDLLADASPLVREAAVLALRELDGEDLGFDPLDPEEARAAAIRRWRERLAESSGD